MLVTSANVKWVGRGGLVWWEVGNILGCVNGFRVLLKNNILHLVIGYFHHLYTNRPFNLWRSEIA